MARRVHVTTRWLRSEAASGRIPHLQAGDRLLFDANVIEAILLDKKKILPTAAYLENEYGINGLYMGVPCKLGSKGVEEIIEIHLTSDERAALQKSAASVQELVDVIGVG